MSSSLQVRCKHCAVREIYRCPHAPGQQLGPLNEIWGCKYFRPKDLGLPPEKKKQGSLGG